MWVADDLGYIRIDSRSSLLRTDETGFIRMDARAGMTICTPGKTVPCGNVCRAPQNCKKGKPGQDRVKAIGKENLKEFAMAERAKRMAKAQGKIAPAKEVASSAAPAAKRSTTPTRQTATSKKKSPPQRGVSLKEIRENKLSRAEQDEFNAIVDRIKKGETDAYEARSQAKSPRVAEAISRAGLGSGATLRKEQKVKMSPFASAPGTVGGLGSARKAQEEDDKRREEESKNFKPDYDVAKRIGSAAKLREGKPITSQSDFDKTIDEAFDRINKEKDQGNLVSIAALRDAMGDRVSKDDFDKFFSESSIRKGYLAVGGEAAGRAGYSVRDEIARGYKTALGGQRFYLKKD